MRENCRWFQLLPWIVSYVVGLKGICGAMARLISTINVVPALGLTSCETVNVTEALLVNTNKL